ncbi:hypothetical protein Mapa_007717 [Marchantia paleacea]|nr:hypothetical protein Mapa_007717 [Marchantia paleacea]
MPKSLDVDFLAFSLWKRRPRRYLFFVVLSRLGFSSSHFFLITTSACTCYSSNFLHLCVPCPLFWKYVDNESDI